MGRALGRPLGLALGFAADRAFGDPRRGHPVAGFGQLATAMQPSLPSSRVRGLGYTACLVGAAMVLGRLVDRGTVSTAVATYVALGGRSLADEARAVHDHLVADDLEQARIQVTHLVGRDPSQLGSEDLARATIESVAENTSDAVVAPLFWGAVAGPAGLLGYRAANTLDAMVGHHTPRYEQFGWASARLDDLLNLAPARLAAGLTVLLGEQRRDAWAAWQRDATTHPSPNAGPVEAAFAGALGLRLGGTNVYDGQAEDRGALGHGGAPRPGDIIRAVELADRVGLGALAVSVVLASRRPRRRR